MSETVRYSGLARKVFNPDGKTTEELAAQIMVDKGIEKEEFYDSYAEALEDETNEEFIVDRNTGTLYKITKEQSMNTDLFLAHTDGDGFINFDVMYYNGGCGFSAAFSEALKNCKE